MNLMITLARFAVTLPGCHDSDLSFATPLKFPNYTGKYVAYIARFAVAPFPRCSLSLLPHNEHVLIIPVNKLIATLVRFAMVTFPGFHGSDLTRATPLNMS